MEDLKPYMVEFEENGTMKPKVYPEDCVVGGDKRQPIIMITYDECMFSSNDRIWRAWTQIGDTYLWPKGHGQKIMVLDFLLLFGRLNLASLSSEQRNNIINKKPYLDNGEAVEIFEYGKNNDGYWDGAKLHKQVVTKALPIAEALYPRYLLVFFLIMLSVILFMLKTLFKLKKWTKA